MWKILRIAFVMELKNDSPDPPIICKMLEFINVFSGIEEKVFIKEKLMKIHFCPAISSAVAYGCGYRPLSGV